MSKGKQMDYTNAIKDLYEMINKAFAAGEYAFCAELMSVVRNFRN